MIPTLAQQWDEFKNLVIPKDAPEIQVVEMQRAFYSGCLITLIQLQNSLDFSELERDRFMQRITKEVREYHESMINKKGPG